MTRDESLQERINAILLREWDTIGISKVADAQDEYDDYVHILMMAVSAPWRLEDIAAELRRIETDEMGLPADESRSRRVAALLLAGR